MCCVMCTFSLYFPQKYVSFGLCVFYSLCVCVCVCVCMCVFIHAKQNFHVVDLEFVVDVAVFTAAVVVVV